MGDLIQLRAGTALMWSTANPVLAQAEPGFETDTRKSKMGDGVTAWNSLAYMPVPQTTKNVVADTTGFGLTISATVATQLDLPAAALHPNEFYTVTNVSTAFFSDGSNWINTHLSPDNITNPPAYTDGQDVRIIAGTIPTWLPVVELRSDNPSGSERAFISMERGAAWIDHAFDIDLSNKENGVFAVQTNNWTAQDQTARNFGGKSFVMVPRGGASFACNYTGVDVNNWVPLDGNLASTFVGYGYGADGWGNDAKKSVNGYFERFSLTEKEYQWLVGQYSGVQVLNSGTGNYTATMKDQNKLFIMDGFVGDFILPNITSGFTCRILLGWGSSNSTINFTAFEADGTTPSHFDVPDASLNVSNTSPWSFNSGAYGVAPHDLMLTIADNGGHYELSSQDFLNWMKGMLAWNKIDKSLADVNDLRFGGMATDNTLVAADSPYALNITNDTGAYRVHRYTLSEADVLFDITSIPNDRPFFIQNRGDSIGSISLAVDGVYIESINGSIEDFVIPPNSWIQCVYSILGGHKLEIVASNIPKLANRAPYYHSHAAGIEGEPAITDNANGTFNVAAGECWFYIDSSRDDTILHTMAAATNLAPTDDVTGYICADRTSKTWLILNAVSTIDYLQYIPYFKVIKRTGSNNMHFQKITHEAHGAEEREHQRELACGEYSRESGTFESIAVDTSLNITASGGAVWAVKRRYVIAAVTTATRQFKCVWNGSAWSISSNTSPVINNTQYNGGSGLTTLTDNYWTINYLYRGIEDQDHIYTVYGNAEFATKELAQASNYLAALPELISAHAVLIGRVIVQKNATTGIICESAFNTVFAASSSISDHGTLSGLGDDDHQQYFNQTRGDERYLQTIGNAASASKASNLTGGNNTTLLGAIPYQSNTDTTVQLSPNTTVTKKFLSQTGDGTNGAAPTWAQLSKSDVGLSSVDNTSDANKTVGKANNIVGGNNTTLLGSIPYQSNTDTTSMIAPNTTATKMHLVMTGTGTNGGTPTWEAIAAAVIGTNQQLAFNDNGTMAGTANVTWDKTNKALDLVNASLGFTVPASQPVAATGEVYLFSSNVAGKYLPTIVGPSGIDWKIQPHGFFSRVAQVICTGSAYSYYGCTTRTDTGGTSTQAARTTGSIKNQIAKITHATGTTSGTIVYSRHASGDMECYLGNAAGSGGFFFGIRFGINTLAAGNIGFVGLMPRGVPTATANTNTYLNAIGVTFQTNSGNLFISGNNGSGTATQTDLGATMPVNTTDAYDLFLFCAPNSATVYYKVVNLTSGAVVTGTLTTKVPAVNTLITPHTWISNNATAATAVIWVGKYFIETDY